MRILPRSKPHRTPAVTPSTEDQGPVLLACRVQRADGGIFTGDLPAWRHRALQMAMLHGRSTGFVELTPGTRALDGRLDIDRRRRREHFVPARNGDQSGAWLDRLLKHAEAITRGVYAARRSSNDPREEVFLGVAPRTARRGGKDAIAGTRFLWIDLDEPGRLTALWELLAERPCHLLVESGGSGGMHAYWKLAEPLPSTTVDADTGEVIEAIERAHLRLIHYLGVDERGKPNVADAQCAERARLMRLAGTVNYKTGRHTRIREANLRLGSYAIDELVGDLPDPAEPNYEPRRGRLISHRDPFRRIPPAEYAKRLAGRAPDRRGFVNCPVASHADRHPSAHLGRDASDGWHCFSCGAGGGIYDFASALLGGPTGRDLRGETFHRARDLVQHTFGNQHAAEGETR